MIVEYLIYLTIFLLPSYIVRFKIGFVPFTLLEVLVLLTFLTWIGEKVRESLTKRRKSPFRLLAALKNPFILVSLGWIILSLMEVLVSVDKSGALGIFKAYFLEPVLFFWVLTDKIAFRKQFLRVMGVLILSGIGIAILAIIQHFTLWDPFAPAEIVQGRVTAVYNTANAVGLFFGPMIGIVAALLFIKRENQKSLPVRIGRSLGLVLILMLAAIYFSFSQGAYVSVIAVGILLSFFYVLIRILRSKFNLLLKILSGLGLLYLLFNLLFFAFLPRLIPNMPSKPIVRQTDNTLTIRLCLWEGTRALLLAKPVLGSGLNGFQTDYVQYYTCDSEPLQYPHNLILNFWVELGIIGLFLITAIIYLYFKTIFINLSKACQKKDSLAAKIGVGLFTAMCYWLVHGLVDAPYFKNDLSLEFWVLVGLALCYSRTFVSDGSLAEGV